MSDKVDRDQLAAGGARRTVPDTLMPRSPRAEMEWKEGSSMSIEVSATTDAGGGIAISELEDMEAGRRWTEQERLS